MANGVKSVSRERAKVVDAAALDVPRAGCKVKKLVV
jgi:hypothetical protein